MMTKRTIKLPLTAAEKRQLRQHKLKICDLADIPVDELEVILTCSADRAKEIHALAIFQLIPSVGIRFAEDLVFLGYYSLDALIGKSGAQLIDDYEVKKGFWVDPCVEDQFRLAVHVAETGDMNQVWWNFTAERKRFRAEHGYPESRPHRSWIDNPSATE